MKLQNYLDIDDIHHLLSSRYTVETMPIKHYLRCYRGRNTKPAFKKNDKTFILRQFIQNNIFVLIKSTGLNFLKIVYFKYSIFWNRKMKIIIEKTWEFTNVFTP